MDLNPEMKYSRARHEITAMRASLVVSATLLAEFGCLRLWQVRDVVGISRTSAIVIGAVLSAFAMFGAFFIREHIRSFRPITWWPWALVSAAPIVFTVASLIHLWPGADTGLEKVGAILLSVLAPGGLLFVFLAGYGYFGLAVHPEVRARADVEMP